MGKKRRKQIDKRIATFWTSVLPLTSKRVRIILSSHEDAAKLAKAVRASRYEKRASFKLSEETNDRIKREETILNRQHNGSY
jgi:hypothetical protein